MEDWHAELSTLELSMMNQQGHLTEAEFEEYAKALRSNSVSTLPEAVRRHMSDCLECRKEVTFLFRVNLNIGDDASEIPAQPARVARTLGRDQKGHGASSGMIYRIAAGFVFLVACGAIFWYVSTRTNDGGSPQQMTQSGVAVDSMRAEESKRLVILAENSAPSPNMEDMATSRLRGSSVHVVAPKLGDTLRAPYVFRWEDGPDSPLTLRILTNREEERTRVSLRSRYFTAPDTMTAGLYYWTLESDGKLLYVGKVYLY